LEKLEKNERINNLYLEIKPILTTFVFEIEKQVKKFLVFCLISILFVLLVSYLPYALESENPLPDTQAEYFQEGFGYLNFISIFTVCFFFASIICYEFSNKTGYIVFPIINKYKLIIGKYLASFTLVFGVMGTFYFTLGYLGIYYYGGPINRLYYQSFLILILYILALSSVVTLFSSFIRSVNMTIVATIMIILVANMMIDNLVILLFPEFEPVYSLAHNFKLVSYILEEDFPTALEDRYIEGGEARGPVQFEIRTWLTPTIEGAITVFLSYTIICFALAAIIFKRKQL
jgi:ABC-type transport system involved in multi-copper enzyme maturation permease subunit